MEYRNMYRLDFYENTIYYTRALRGKVKGHSKIFYLEPCLVSPLFLRPPWMEDDPKINEDQGAVSRCFRSRASRGELIK